MRKQSGLSIIELLVILGILYGLVLLALGDVDRSNNAYDAGVNYWENVEQRVDDNARRTLVRHLKAVCFGPEARKAAQSKSVKENEFVDSQKDCAEQKINAMEAQAHVSQLDSADLGKLKTVLQD